MLPEQQDELQSPESGVRLFSWVDFSMQVLTASTLGAGG